MSNIEIKRKIKSQKNAALLLIIVPAIVLLRTLIKGNFVPNTTNEYVSAGVLLVIAFCGFLGLRNSIRKEKELQNS